MIKKINTIDGLRFVAIFGVVFYHMKPEIFKSGFLGVDIFFVISGFLITKTYEEKNYNFKKFIVARLRRILPMLIITLTGILIFSFFFYQKKDFLFTINSIVAAIFFFSNYYFWHFTSYFNDFTKLSPTIHTWSLSVEMQLYLITPLLLFILRKKIIEYKLITLITLILLSLIATQYFSIFHNNFNFFSVTSRLFEFFSGSSCFYLLKKLKIKKNKLFNFLQFMLLIILFLSFFIFEKINFPNILSLVIIIPTCIIILTCENNYLSNKLLSNKIVSYIGKISYSIYLIHFPFLIFAKYTNYNSELLLLLSIIISILTYNLIEKPFLNKKLISDKIFLILLFISVTILALVIVIIKNNENFHDYKFKHLNLKEQKILIAANLAYNSFNYENMFFDNKCRFWSKIVDYNFEKNFEDCSKNTQSVTDGAIMIIGDSHAMNLYNAISMNLNDSFVISISQGGCRIHTRSEECKFEDLKDFLIKNKNKIKKLLFTSSGIEYLHKDSSIDFRRIDTDYFYLIGLGYNKNQLYWIGPNIETNISLKDLNIINIVENKKFDLLLNKNILLVDKYLKEFLSDKIKYISKIELLNYNLNNDFIIEGNITFARSSHWSTYGEKFFGRRLLNNKEFENILH